MEIRRKLLIGAAVTVAFFMAALDVFRIVGLIRPFSVPTGAMTPTILPGDHIIMEGFTFLGRRPHRGDVVVFKTDGIESLPKSFYTKRVAGEPGDRLRITNGKLYVNDMHVALSNANGQIHYVFVRGSRYLTSECDTVTVPNDQYFMLGDNSGRSADSRFWGGVPAKNITGRVWLCYWPPWRVGVVE